MYDKWPSSFQELLKPAYAGIMRQIRRNLYNMVGVSGTGQITCILCYLCPGMRAALDIRDPHMKVTEKLIPSFTPSYTMLGCN